MSDNNKHSSGDYLFEEENFDIKNINKPHDHLFKWSLARPDVMSQFLKVMMTKSQIESLNFKTLEITKANYIDDLLKETFSDVVYNIEKEDGIKAKICLLFEHKSSPEEIAPIKTLRYISNAYMDNFKNGRTTQVIPILFYHGSKNWNIPVRLSELLSGDIYPFEENTPDFKHLFIDLNKTDNLVDSTTDPEIRVYFKAIRIANCEDIDEATDLFLEVLNIFDEPGWKSSTLNKRFFQITMLYLSKVSILAQEKNIFDLAQKEKPERGEDIMTLYETIQNDAKKSTLVRQLNQKFSSPLPQDIELLLESADEEKVLELTDKIFEIQSYEDVREILQN